MLAFEGWDAAGKGGVIRRVTAALEAGDYRVIPVAAPTQEERKFHYLWRFWRDQVPAAGKFVIFDRTWYGRVLVERLEGFATLAEWQRAYDEINDFGRSSSSTAATSRSSGCTSPRKSSCPASRPGRTPSTRSTRSPRRTTATASGARLSTSRPSTRWCCAPPRSARN